MGTDFGLTPNVVSRAARKLSTLSAPRHYGTAQMKFAASSMLPLPLCFATCG